jgi:hypothetical protein
VPVERNAADAVSASVKQFAFPYLGIALDSARNNLSEQAFIPVLIWPFYPFCVFPIRA